MRNPFKTIKIFFHEMISELKKAIWPTFKELKNFTVIVLVGIFILGIYISLIDFSLFQVISLFSGWAKNKIF